MKISIFSAPQGSGASTAAALLYSSLKEKGRRPVCIDYSVYPSLDIYLSEDLKIHKDITDENIDKENYIEGKKYEAGHQDIIKRLCETSGITDILFDTSTENGTEGIFDLSDKILLVLTLDNQSLRAANRMLSYFSEDLLRKTEIIINKDTEKMSYNREVIYDLVEGEIAGVIPYSEDLRVMLDRGKTEEISEDIKAVIKQISNRVLNISEIDFSDDEQNSEEKTEGSLKPEEKTEPLKKPGVFARFFQYFRTDKDRK